jgi:hypothetical protein
MEAIPLIEQETYDTQSLTTWDITAPVAAAAGRTQISNQIDIDRERGAIEHKSAADSQSEEVSAPLFEQNALQDFGSRWGTIRAGFVDNPAGAVMQAHELVTEVMKRLAMVFAAERENLEQEWAKGDDISTEDLRIALCCYRSFFGRLLSVK